MTAIYLDNNATTQVAPEVLEAMLPYFHDFVWQSFQHALLRGAGGPAPEARPGAGGEFDRRSS